MSDLDLTAMMQQLAALARPEPCEAAVQVMEFPTGLLCHLTKAHGGRHYDRVLKQFFDAPDVSLEG